MKKKVYFEDPELETRILIMKKYPPEEFKAMETLLDILKEIAPHLFSSSALESKEMKK